MLEQVDFGRLIKEKRATSKLTQEQLGARLGVTGSVVSKWESNDMLPDIRQLASICRKLSISADTLLGLENLRPKRGLSGFGQNKSHFWVPFLGSIPLVFVFSTILGLLFRNYHPLFFVTPIVSLTVIVTALIAFAR